MLVYMHRHGTLEIRGVSSLHREFAAKVTLPGPTIDYLAMRVPLFAGD